MALPISTYGDWYAAITQNDLTSVKEILESKDDSDKDHLLNGEFVFDGIKEEAIKNRIVRKWNCARPLNVAATLGGQGIVLLFLEGGADIYQSENCGNNILHSLVLKTYFSPDYAQEAIKIYDVLKEKLSTEQLKHLLKSQNQLCLYPLEYAVHLECFELATKFVDTEEVYVQQTYSEGIFTWKWIDVSDYERHLDGHNVVKARSFSIPMLITYLDKKCLKRESTKAFFQSPLVKEWVKKKMESNLPMVILWVILRLSFITSYNLYDTLYPWTEDIFSVGSDNSSGWTYCGVIHRNGNMPSPLGVLFLVYLILYSCGSILFVGFDAIRTITGRNHYHLLGCSPHGRKTFIAHTMFYRLAHLVASLCILILSFNALLAHSTSYKGLSVTVIHFIYMVANLTLIWYLLYFIQLLPVIGHSVVAVQGLLTDMVLFGVLILILAFPFASAYFHIALETRSDPTCPKQFTSLISSYYSMVILIFDVNMDDDIYENNDLMIFHILYIFIGTLLLLNFLIAIFSDRVSTYMAHKNLFLTIQRMCITSELESRYGFMFAVKRLLYERQMSHYSTSDNGTLCLIVMEITPTKKAE